MQNTQTDLDRGRDLYIGGATIRDAAKAIQCDDRRLSDYLKKTGVLRDPSPWTGDDLGPKRIAMLRELWPDRSLSATAIAARIGRKYGRSVSRSAILSKAKNLGLIARKIGAPEKSMNPYVQVKRANTSSQPYFSSPLRLDKKPENGIRFEDLEKGMCKFPLGGTLDPVEFFCGAKAHGIYCERHAAIAVRGRVSADTLLRAA